MSNQAELLRDLSRLSFLVQDLIRIVSSIKDSHHTPAAKPSAAFHEYFELLDVGIPKLKGRGEFTMDALLAEVGIVGLKKGRKQAIGAELRKRGVKQRKTNAVRLYYVP